MPKWTQKSVTAIPSALSVAGTLAAAVVLQAGGRLALGARVAERRHLKMTFKGERNVRCYSVDERNTSATSNFFANVHRDFGQLDVVVIDAFRRSNDKYSLEAVFRNFLLCVSSAIPYAKKDLLFMIIADHSNDDLLRAAPKILNLILAVQCENSPNVRLSFISKSKSNADFQYSTSVMFPSCAKTQGHSKGAETQLIGGISSP